MDLIEASRKGRIDDVRSLINAGAYVDERGIVVHITPMIHAAKEGHVEVVRMLFEAGATVNIQDETGKTALLAACSWGHLEIAQLLLDAGASPGRERIKVILQASLATAKKALLVYSKINL